VWRVEAHRPKPRSSTYAAPRRSELEFKVGSSSRPRPSFRCLHAGSTGYPPSVLISASHEQTQSNQCLRKVFALCYKVLQSFCHGSPSPQVLCNLVFAYSTRSGGLRENGTVSRKRGLVALTPTARLSDIRLAGSGGWLTDWSRPLTGCYFVDPQCLRAAVWEAEELWAVFPPSTAESLREQSRRVPFSRGTTSGVHCCAQS